MPVQFLPKWASVSNFLWSPAPVPPFAISAEPFQSTGTEQRELLIRVNGGWPWWALSAQLLLYYVPLFYFSKELRLFELKCSQQLMYKPKDRVCDGQLCISCLKSVVNSVDVPGWEAAKAMGCCWCLGALKGSSLWNIFFDLFLMKTGLRRDFFFSSTCIKNKIKLREVSSYNLCKMHLYRGDLFLLSSSKEPVFHQVAEVSNSPREQGEAEDGEGAAVPKCDRQGK